MNEYGEVVEAGTVIFRRTLPGPIDRVWAYLTESEKRRKWLARGEMALQVGGAVTLIFRHSELTQHDETPPERHRSSTEDFKTEGQVTRCDPPRLLAFTWGPDGARSEVTFELTPSEDGQVQLLLTHRRLRDRAETVDVAGGWHTHLAILEAQLAGREPPPFWSTLERVEADYEQRVPAG